MFRFSKDNVSKWFASLSFEDRKILLSNLHDLRFNLSQQNKRTLLLRDLIFQLENIHEKEKNHG